MGAKVRTVKKIHVHEIPNKCTCYIKERMRRDNAQCAVRVMCGSKISPGRAKYQVNGSIDGEDARHAAGTHNQCAECHQRELYAKEEIRRKRMASMSGNVQVGEDCVNE